jgi:hypothetical protein
VQHSSRHLQTSPAAELFGMPSAHLLTLIVFAFWFIVRPSTVEVQAQYIVNPETAGPTAGGGTITISGAWDTANWTPVVTLQGMIVPATSMWMTQTSLTIKSPIGPGCTDAFLDVNSKTGASGTVTSRLKVVFCYDAPTITAVLPRPAQFGSVSADRSMTIFGTNFGRSSCPANPIVQVRANCCLGLLKSLTFVQVGATAGDSSLFLDILYSFRFFFISIVFTLLQARVRILQRITLASRCGTQSSASHRHSQRCHSR